MAAVPEYDDQAETFASIAALGPHGDEAARNLTHLKDELSRLGAHDDAERLSVADDAAKRGEFSVLERFVALGIPLHELSENQQSRIRRIVGWRNAVALLPLLFTWIALAWASYDYYHLVRARPNLTTQPFLVLWQRRFDGGHLPTFAETAVLSFFLLSIVLVLTVWAHRLESTANQTLAKINTIADDALYSLGLAIETSNVRPPENAKEWAEAAQRVLTETQQMIKTAVRDTTTLAEKNNAISESASEQLGQLQVRAEELLKGVGTETREVMVTLQRQSEQTTTQVGEEATRVLKQAGEANRQLVEQQMAPLFTGFQTSLADYRKDQEVYRASAAALSGGVGDLATAASGLAGGVGSYTEVAQSIDEKLRLIGTAQADLVEKITEHSAGLVSASTDVRGVAELLTGSVKSDFETLARNVVAASSSLVDIERNLAATGTSLAATTRSMEAAAAGLTHAATLVTKAASGLPGASGRSSRRRFFRRPFGRSR